MVSAIASSGALDVKAMILAAGRGERMHPLTEHTPKPLLSVGGKALIEYHLEHLASAGFREVVINIAYLGEQIREHLGDGKCWQLNIHYSIEPEPLETAGAILHALPLLGQEPFALINADVWTDYPLIKLITRSLDQSLGHVLLVENPQHNVKGDFSILKGYLAEKTQTSFTFSGISVLNPKLITHYPKKRKQFPLAEVFRAALKEKKLSAEWYQGEWWDIGTVARLHALNKTLQNRH